MITKKWMDVNITEDALDRRCNDLQGTALCYAHPACRYCIFDNVEYFKEYIRKAQKEAGIGENRGGEV